jgi:hypothetical protein
MAPPPAVHHTQQHHLRHRRRQRQHQLEAGALAGRAGGLDAPAHRVDLGAHHVEADTAARQLGHLVGRAEPGAKDEVGQFAVAGLMVGLQKAALDGALADALEVEPRAVVAAVDADLVAFLRHGDLDLTGRVLACGQALRW